MVKSVVFDALGRSWALRFDFNALCRIEDMFGRPVSDLGQILTPDGEAMRMGDLRRVFSCGLQDRVSLDAVGDIMGDLGLEVAADLVLKALQLAFPEAGTVEGKTKGAAR